MARSLFPEFDGEEAEGGEALADRRRRDPSRSDKRPSNDNARGDEPVPAAIPIPGVGRAVPPPPQLRPGERPLPGLADERSPDSEDSTTDESKTTFGTGNEPSAPLPIVPTPSAPEPIEADSLSASDLAAIFSGEGTNSVESDDELVPARMLNEFAYCPRLAYLEWLQGEFEDNLETREGAFAHRRVDKPTRASFALPKPEEVSGDGSDSAERDDAPGNEEGLLTADRLGARALMLSAHSEGLVAKLDLLELDGRRAVPVDYKRGSVPDNAWQSWEPERVQLCAQGLILRANGYDCDHGILYYVESKRRVRIDFDDTLIARTRTLVTEMRALSTRGPIPPPLVDSPKCPRCSLVGICLPDETRLLAELQRHETPFAPDLPDTVHDSKTPPQDVRIRNLLPSRDDAFPLSVQQQGATLAKDGERLIVKPREGKPVVAPFIEVSQVSLFGNVQVSTPLIRG